MGPHLRRTSPAAAASITHHIRGSKNNIETQAAVDYLTKVIEKTPDVFAEFTEIMRDFKSSKISVHEVKGKVANLFQGHDEILLGFNVFLPEEHKITIPVQPVLQPVLPQVHAQEAKTFVNLIKTRFADEPSVYKSFLKVLDFYKTNQKSFQEIAQEVEVLFKDHPDLFGGFIRFLPINNKLLDWQFGSFRQEDRSSYITFQVPQPIKAGNLLEQKASTSKNSEISDHGEGDEREYDPSSKKQRWENGAQSIPHHSSDEDKESLSGAQLSIGEDEVREEEEIVRERLEKRVRTHPLIAKEIYNLCKPVSEFDLSNCKQCTPSYRLLPEHLVHPSSHRTEHENSLLNDTCVLVTSGSEDYSFKHMRKNQYEESLFLCEDDRFEFDMLVELAKSTIQKIEKLMRKIKKGSINLGEPIEIEDYLTPMNVRCIEKLYGDHGLDAIEVLQQNPAGALPVIRGRLKQKLEEWDHQCTDFNKIWSDVYAKNYHKSLDHRSFNVKQQDTANLISKAQQAEIFEKHERDDQSQFPRSKLSVFDSALAFGGSNMQRSCIDQSTKSIVSSTDL